jgi:hypothetical protein
VALDVRKHIHAVDRIPHDVHSLTVTTWNPVRCPASSRENQVSLKAIFMQVDNSIKRSNSCAQTEATARRFLRLQSTSYRTVRLRLEHVFGYQRHAGFHAGI